MEANLFSIVITNFNKAGMVDLAVRSALDQTLRDRCFEVVVVDDCSTDDSLLALRGISGNARIIENANNSGALISTLAGVAAARGTHIVTLDGDDILAPNLLQMLLESNLLHSKRLIRGGIRHYSDPVAAQRSIETVRVRRHLSPAWKLTLEAKTGGSSLVFPRQSVLDLWGRFPGIAVQDHVIPELLALRLDDYVQLDCVTHFCYAGDAVAHLSSDSTQLHHDRLLCGWAVLRDAIELRHSGGLIRKLRRRLVGRCLRYCWKYRLGKVASRYADVLSVGGDARLFECATVIAKELRLRYPAIRYYERELMELDRKKAA